MNDPRNFEEYVRHITITVFRFSGQPISDVDLHTAVNIILFFARVIHLFFMFVLSVVFFTNKIRNFVNNFVKKYKYYLFAFLSACLTEAYVNDDTTLTTFNYLPYAIGKIIIFRTWHYIWYIILGTSLCFVFQVFMLVMRHQPQRASM
jgi:hypothetical protein